MVRKLFITDYFYFLVPMLAGVCVLLILCYLFYHRQLKIIVKLRTNFMDLLENEKLKISRELHDSMGPFLVPLKGFVKQSDHFVSADRVFWNDHISRFENHIGGLNERLYPSELLENNVGDALNGISSNFMFSDTKFIVAKFPELYLKGNSGIHIYRIIQESVLNIIKHVQPEFITISYHLSDRVLQINVSYQSDITLFNKTVTKGRRGQSIINQRLELLKSNYELVLDENLVFEKFIFSIQN